MPSLDALPELCPKNAAAWRAWLRKNHEKSPGVWLVYFKVGSAQHNLSYSDAVDEALCWGWIDSKVQPLDAERYRQVFTPRKKGSVWSALNKRKIASMEELGRMQPAGRARIEAAIADGSWTQLDAVEALEVPPDLDEAFAADGSARSVYDSLTRGKRKTILYFLNSAKREETRRLRIAKICDALRAGKMPVGG